MDGPQPATFTGPPLLATKLHPPRWRSDLVSRPRLVDALRREGDRALTLVSASAGFGKSTLLAEWLATDTAPDRAVAWLSLDHGDNDPILFWTYVLAALDACRPGVGAQARALLHAPQPPAIEAVLTVLINELAAVEGETVLVLDDVHLIEAQPIQHALIFLLDHLPPRLRLVMTTRADPPLPLARLRARGQLTEVRASDLRFTTGEAAQFLAGATGREIPAADVAALETRTEGWIAGLQLAALSMRGEQDIQHFIRTFAGDHRHVVDYLVEEVLQRLPDDARRFLLSTSILDRLNAGLCNAVTERDDSGARLETLERGNFFLVPLDDTRHWYRYHHLFGDVLRARLRAEQPEVVPTLHRRASAWYEQQGLPTEAIRHALAAGDAGRGADLTECNATAMRRNRQEATLLTWLRQIPDQAVRCRPVLSAVYAGVLLTTGHEEGVEPRLLNAQRWLDAWNEDRDAALAAGMVVVDHEEFRRLPGSLAVHRAGQALAAGQIDEAVCHAERALGLIPPDDDLYRGAASAILGLSFWTNGQLDAAYHSYAEGMASLRRAGYIADIVGGVIARTDIRIAQGRLRDAMATYQEAERIASAHNGPTLRGTADLYVGMSALYREWNDLDAARRHLSISAELGEALAFPQNPYRWCVVMARVNEAEGRLDAALDLLDEAALRYTSDFHPDTRPIAAMKARVWIVQRRLDDALKWARAQGLSADDDLSYLREFAHVTLARLLLAQAAGGQSPDALRQGAALLDRLLAAADAGGRTGSVIEILVLQALACQQRGDLPAALTALESALRLAEPEGYVRVFVDEGEPMRALLREAIAHGRSAPYAVRLLDAFVTPAAGTPAATPAAAPVLPEPLTAREIEVLRLIAAGLRNQEIADRLFVSLPTVKRHVANAYGKLGVTHRTEAVARANELRLL